MILTNFQEALKQVAIKITPGVVFQPKVYRGMQNGINQLVEAVRPTLGPLPGVVAIERVGRGKAPELLDSGGLIARRILQLPDRAADMGAMFLRHLLWQMHEEVGDGTATTAVLFQEIYNQGVRYIVSGGNAMLVRRYLEAGMFLILSQLSELAVPLEGQAKLAQMAELICYEPRLAEILGEIFDLIGEYGQLDLRSGRSQTLEREYIEGSYWDGGLLVREMINDQAKQRAELTQASILISDLDLEDPHALLPVLVMAKQAGVRNLLIVANKLADSVTALLRSASREPQQFLVIAAKTPGKTYTDQVEASDRPGDFDRWTSTGEGCRRFPEWGHAGRSRTGPPGLGRPPLPGADHR